MAGSPLSPNEGVNYDFLLRRPSAILESQFEDGILAIGTAMSAVEFRDTVTNALHLVLSGVKQTLVLLLDLETNELAYFNSDYPKPMPKSGIVWEVVRRRTSEISKMPIAEDDPIRKLLPNFTSLQSDEVVIINPIVEKKFHRVVALYLVVCLEPPLSQLERLRWLERNVLVAASRVLKHMAAERERNRAEGMLRVCGDLIDLDTVTLSVKILRHIKLMLSAEKCFLFVIDEATNELYCQVFDEEPMDKEIRKPTTEGLYGVCYSTCQAINITDVSQDVRFNPEVDFINDYKPTTMLCMPMRVQGEEGKSPVAVAVACNKNGGQGFTHRDEDNMSFILRFCASVLANTLAFQRELTIKKQNEALLGITRNLFSSLNDLNMLLNKIMQEARTLTSAERCSLFLLDPAQQELVAVVFDSHLQDEEQEPLRIGIGQGIAGYVAKTGKLVNIRDAYKHPKFFKEVDKSTGFRTKNMLCFPITNNTGAVVGVAELCNKKEGRFFTKYDEELATSFSVYCGISIYQSKLYKKLKVSQGRSQLATELMIYHMEITPNELKKQIVQSSVPACHTFSERMRDFVFSPRSIPEDDTVMAVVSMAHEMGLIKRWRLPMDILAKFVLMVKKAYRNPPYHNWYHALSVAHFSYLLFHNCDKLTYLSDIEVLALFFSCLCHDIDHRGTNNAFQVSSNSVLASLYSSEGSVMERHHFSQTLCILNSENCNIFENLSPSDYKQVLDLIQHNILATDIATHLRHMRDISKMAATGFIASDPTHHKLLCSLLMTSCDLCANCKEWPSAEAISKLIYTEFFTQGDLEKALGDTPSEMMDRDKAFIPELQLGFLDGIAAPVYKVLAQVLPETVLVYKSLQENRKLWVDLKKEGRKNSDPGGADQ